MNTRRTICCLLLGVSAACERAEIRSYDAPKDPPSAVATPAPPKATPAARNAPPRITWTLPDGWSQHPGSGMRFATLKIDAADPPLEVRVTPLGMGAAETLGNVQRWAGMIGMQPVTQEQLPKYVQTMQVDGKAVDLVNLTGPASDDKPAQQTLAAIMRTDVAVWFFAVTADAQKLAPHAKDFEALIKSIRFESAAPPAPQATEAAPSPTAKAGKLTFQAPANWRQDPAPGNMRVASFLIGDDDDEGEVSVTRFPGNVGGLLSNINRWRGQVGLPNISDLEEQVVTRADVAGMPGLALDLVEEEEDPQEARRMIVILQPRDGLTWFFKMTGSAALLEKQKDAFAAFIHSVKFTGDDA